MPGTIIKSFRLEEQLLKKISMLARQHGVAENQLVSKWLSSRADVDCLISPLGGVVLGTETLRAILGTGDVDALELSAWELGKEHFARARVAFETVGERLTYLKYLRYVLSEHARWFRFASDSKSQELILEHEFSLRWSVFLWGYLSGAYSVLSKERLSVEMGESFVKVRFQEQIEVT